MQVTLRTRQSPAPEDWFPAEVTHNDRNENWGPDEPPGKTQLIGIPAPVEERNQLGLER